VVGNSGIPIGLFVVPNLVASGGLAVKSKTKRFEALDNLSVFKTG
jgi:hypothetical protein